MIEDRIPTEVMQIIRAGLEGDDERVRAYAELWANNMIYSGHLKSADRIRRVLRGETGPGVTLDHVCGAQGFDSYLGDTCPACQARNETAQ